MIIPVYNSSDTLALFLESVLVSDYGDVQVIVVDDGSTDGIPEIARALCETITLPVHAGPANAGNEGAKLATGAVLFFLDADIMIEKNTIGKIMTRLESRPELGGLFCSYQADTPVHTFYSKFKTL